MLIAIVNAAIVVLGIGALIFVHELGHFLVAKKVGIRVHAFSLGFGPRIFGFVRGDTEYKLCAIPLGGYVKMAGEYPGEDNEGVDPEGMFTSKTISQRAWVVSAGVIMNVIFAMIAFPIAFSAGVPMDSTVVGNVRNGSPAWHAGLQAGDEIIQVNDSDVLGFSDVRISVATADEDDGVDLRILRDGTTQTINLTPEYDEASGLMMAGILPALAPLHFADGARALDAGISTDDEILQIEGIPSAQLIGLGSGRFPHLFSTDNKALRFLVRRAGSGAEETVLVPTFLKDAEDEDRPMIGVSICRRYVEDVADNSPAARAGLKPGMILRSVNGNATASDVDIRREFLSIEAGQTFTLIVSPSDGATTTETLTSSAGEGAGLSILNSVVLSRHGLELNIRPNMPAAVAGLQTGDELVALGSAGFDATDDNAFSDFVTLVKDAGTEPFAITIRRGGEEKTFQVQPEPSRAQVNGTLTELAALRILSKKVAVPFPGSIKAGFSQALYQTKNILMNIRSLFSGQVAAKNLGGIIAIAQVSYTFAEQGLAKILFFLAILSLNLAVLNILPIPVLDGGHLVFLAVEKIKGGPVSDRILGLANWVGLIFILALMVFVTFNDIKRIVS